MLHGDISNHEASIIAFNIDNLLFLDKKNDNFFNKLIGGFESDKRKYFNRSVNKEFLNRVLYVWRNYPYSIYFVTFQKFQQDIENFLVDKTVTFTRLEYFDNLDDLRYAVNQRYYYYFDSDASIISYMSSNGALNMSEFSKLFR
jgi:hypothetical protein